MPVLLKTGVEFAIENWADLYRDMQKEGLVKKHWEELALDKDKYPPQLDDKRYLDMESIHMLAVFTMRDNGRLVGYFVAFIVSHMHYSQAGPMAHTDFYYIRPEYRKGGAGVRLLKFVEAKLRENGIVKWYLSTKVHQYHGPLFKLLGFKMSDVMFTKVL